MLLLKEKETRKRLVPSMGGKSSLSYIQSLCGNREMSLEFFGYMDIFIAVRQINREEISSYTPRATRYKIKRVNKASSGEP